MIKAVHHVTFDRAVQIGVFRQIEAGRLLRFASLNVAFELNEFRTFASRKALDVQICIGSIFHFQLTVPFKQLLGIHQLLYATVRILHANRQIVRLHQVRGDKALMIFVHGLTAITQRHFGRKIFGHGINIRRYAKQLGHKTVAHIAGGQNAQTQSSQQK